ncbi:hypothetical protein JNO48_10570 [Clostridiales bacterium]|nr:hypothetical protein JNO48_10570 [Clostridiales bacterium]
MSTSLFKKVTSTIISKIVESGAPDSIAAEEQSTIKSDDNSTAEISQSAEIQDKPVPESNQEPKTTSPSTPESSSVSNIVDNFPVVNSVPDSLQPVSSTAGLPEDDMARDLGERVMKAIGEWRAKYHLEKLPDKIVLTQAMNILYVLNNGLK